MNNYQLLGKKLREAREALGITQEFVAQKIGLSRPAIVAIESAKRKVDSFELFSLAELYGVDVKSLLSLEEQPPVFTFGNPRSFALHMRSGNALEEKSIAAIMEFLAIGQDYIKLRELNK